jgi:hypothetical protein
MRAVFAILAAVLGAAVGCGGGGEKRAAESPYDTTVPLEYVDRGLVSKDYPIAVDDVSYATPAGNRIGAMLVVPAGSGLFPGAVHSDKAFADQLALLAGSLDPDGSIVDGRAGGP